MDRIPHAPAVYAPARRPSAGFTLVELLVVIGIIALLISILLPVLGRAREAANRTVCASNLRTWGQAAHLWAAENKGAYPRAFVHGLGVPFPTVVNTQSGGRNPNGANWRGRTYSSDEWVHDWGLTLERMYKMGLEERLLTCPSAEVQNPPPYTPDAWWGEVQVSNYMYVGGLSRGTFNAGFGVLDNWGSRPAAFRSNDSRSAERVLAADDVSFNTPRSDPTTGYASNHTWRKGRPVFQNVLYGDGHVDGMTDPYRYPLNQAAPGPITNPASGNWTVRHTGGGPYFYWPVPY